MVDSNDLMKIVLDELDAVLRNYGFRRFRQMFRARRDETTQVVHIQRSTNSTRYQVRFTINLGVFSHVIAEGIHQMARTPTKLQDVHWEERIGHVIPERQDTWWTVSSEFEAAKIGRHAADLLEEYALPAMERFSSSEKMYDYFADPGRYGRAIVDDVRERYMRALAEHLAEKAEADQSDPARAAWIGTFRD